MNVLTNRRCLVEPNSWGFKTRHCCETINSLCESSLELWEASETFRNFETGKEDLPTLDMLLGNLRA